MRFVSGQPSYENIVKLDVDGSSFLNPQLSDYGCLITNSSSNWIMGVSSSHGNCFKYQKAQPTPRTCVFSTPCWKVTVVQIGLPSSGPAWIMECKFGVIIPPVYFSSSRCIRSLDSQYVVRVSSVLLFQVIKKDLTKIIVPDTNVDLEGLSYRKLASNVLIR